MKLFPFFASGAISIFFSILWFFAIKISLSRQNERAAEILLAGYALVVAASLVVSNRRFRADPWKAAAGSMAGSLLFLGFIAAGVAWHQYTTTR